MRYWIKLGLGPVMSVPPGRLRSEAVIRFRNDGGTTKYKGDVSKGSESTVSQSNCIKFGGYCRRVVVLFMVFCLCLLGVF